MIAKILNKMPAKDWGLASIKQNKNGNMLVRQLIQRLIKGKQPVVGAFNQQNKNGNILVRQLIQRLIKGKQPAVGAFNQQNKNVNMLVRQLIQRLVKGKQPVVGAFGNPGQMDFPLKGFRIKEAGGGGDCFYRSVMEALGVGSEKFMKLRKSAANNAKKFSEKLNRIISGFEAPTGSDTDIMSHLAAESPTGDASSYINALIKEIYISKRNRWEFKSVWIR